MFESNNLNSTTGFWPFRNVSVVTTGGIILMRRSAFLFPKEAVNCSCVNPSPNTGFDQSDNKTGAKIIELIIRPVKKKESLDEFMN